MSNAVEFTSAPITLDPRYYILQQIGAGGMGVVYSARDRLTNEIVALKSVTAGQTLSAENTTRLNVIQRVLLAEEFQTLASLQHPNIISVIDYGFDSNKQPYFTMDLLKNASNIVQVARQTSTLVGKIELLAQMLQAISYLHRRGIIHRDLKPGNILVQDSQVKLLDFGLASLKHTDDEDSIVGTPAYFAPEVILGDATTPASDLYAVGVIIYEIFAGRLPFRASSIENLIQNILQDQPDMTAFFDLESALKPDPELTEDIRQHTLVVDPSDFAGIQTLEVASPKDEKTTQLEDSNRFSKNEIAVIVQDGIEHPIPKPTLANVVERLLYKDPTLRYQSAESVIHDLETIVGKRLVVETAATRESFLESAPFIGREEELDQLWGALQQAIEGAGSTWLIHGESGIGKSRLLEELRIRALVHGITVFHSRASSELDAPYQLWRDILRRLLLHSNVGDYEASVLKTIIPNVGTLLGRPIMEAPALSPDQANKRLISVITSLFAKQTQPIVVLLEGLHWVRAETLILLERLSKIAPKQKLLLVGSYRSDESMELSPLLHSLPRLHLKRFTADEIFQLTEAMLGKAAHNDELQEFLQRETEGNARFIIDVLRTLAEQAGKVSNIGAIELPARLTVEGIQYLFQRRLARIPASDFPLLYIAALIGRELDLKILRKADPAIQLEAWLLACSEAAVIELDHEQWSFSHDKLRQELLDQLSPQNKRIYAERAALAIEAAYADKSDHAPLLVHLWGIVGNFQKERYYRIIAAEQSYRAETYTQAIDYLQRPFVPELNGSNGQKPLEQATLIHLAKCEMQLNHYDDAVALAENALKLDNISPDDSIRAEGVYILGYSQFYLGNAQDAGAYFKQSLSLYRRLENISGIGESLHGLAMISLAQGDYATAERCLEESLINAKQIGNLWEVATAYSDLGHVAMMRANFAIAEQYLDQSLSISHSIEYRAGVAAVLMLLGVVSQFRNKTTQATEYLLESLSISQEIGDQRTAADALNYLGTYASARQDYAEAERWLTQSLAIYDSLNFRWGMASVLIRLAYAALGTGYTAIAKHYLHESLYEAKALNAVPLELEAIVALAQVLRDENNIVQAVEWISMVNHHPAANPEVKSLAERLFATLYGQLSSSEVDKHLANGRQLELSRVIDTILNDLSSKKRSTQVVANAPSAYVS